jgi:class 3 adenylate cyclase
MKGARMDRPLVRRILHPRSWPIAVKITLLLIVASIIPMMVTAALDVRQAREAASKSVHDNLRRLAQTGAARIDQLLTDTARTAAVVAGDAEVIEFLANGGQKDSAALTLANVAGASDDVAHVFLLDGQGTCVLSTRAAELGLSYAHRSYYQDARKAGRGISEVLTGVTTNKPGVYFSHVVTHKERGVVGVAVVKLSGDVIGRLVEASKPTAGEALLVDSYGVVVANTANGMLYKSLAPLSADVMALPVFDRRFASVGVERVQSLDLPDLAARLVRAKAPGEVDVTLPGAGLELLGYAPVSANAWTLAVYEPAARLEAPFARVTRRAELNGLFVGLAVTLFALVLARTIVRPVRRLTEAAQAVRRGDFTGVVVDAGPEDEIGMLGHAFNRMARGLAERERERDIFGRMVSPEVREKLLAGNLELGGETRRAVVLFSDIRGFSTLSEKMDPQAVVALLNEYLTAMTAATSAWNGYINARASAPAVRASSSARSASRSSTRPSDRTARRSTGSRATRPRSTSTSPTRSAASPSRRSFGSTCSTRSRASRAPSSRRRSRETSPSTCSADRRTRSASARRASTSSSARTRARASPTSRAGTTRARATRR